MLRDGWPFVTEEAKPEPAKQSTPDVKKQAKPAVEKPAKPVLEKPVSKSQAKTTTKARVSPQDLLPRRWFDDGAITPIPAPGKKQAKESKPEVKSKPARGSAQARMLRESRVSVANRPTPRAGSVLSKPRSTKPHSTKPNPTKPIAIKPSKPAPVAKKTIPVPTTVKADSKPRSRASAALARSIAADVASSLGAGAPKATVKPVEKVNVEPAQPEPVAKVKEEESKEAGPALAEAGKKETRLSVAANRSSTVLPLFIGDRYSSLKNKTAEEDPAPKPAFLDKIPLVAEATTKTPTKQAPVDPDAVLLTQKMPILVSRVSGPRTIVVGREATYTVVLANRGEIDAEQVETRVTAPEWAEVVSVDSEGGVVQSNTGGGSATELLWRNDRLAVNKALKLNVKLIARSGRPISLGVVSEHKPVDGSTLVEVQEPKLALELVGPEEVLFGKPCSFRLTLSNPGTGLAEKVSLKLTPPGGDTSRQTNHRFGDIAAGESRSVEIELTARQAGRLMIDASAQTTDGITADLSKEVFCRKPELAVDWRGPKERYAGAPAVYYFRVRNPGTAEAKDVNLSVTLPTGFDVIAGDATPKSTGGRMSYRVGTLRPQEDKYFELRGVFTRAGENEMSLRAEASDNTFSEVVTTKTEVVAIADLKLDVLDPQGPIATGEEATYQIRVTNRGASEAREVEIVGLFSAGIDPHHAEGGASSIHDGRVAFETIESLPAGEERVFKIHARAHKEGTHLFRAEVSCLDLEIKLAAEETTRFFQDESINVASDSVRTGSATGFGYSR